MSSPLLSATSISAALAMGFASVFFRSLQVPFESLHLSKKRLDRLNQLLILSWIPLMPLAGWLVDHWGIHEVLFTGSLILALTVSWIALCQNDAGLTWGVVGLGIAGACVTTAGVCLMPEALTLFPRWSVGAALCLGFVFVGLATLLTPIAIPWLLRRLPYQRTVLALGLLCLIPAILVAIVQMGNPNPETEILGGRTSVYDVRFWLVALIAFLYFPLEKLLEIWPRAYLSEIGYDARSLARLLIGFWCAFLIFRFGLGWMIRVGNEAWLVLIILIVSSMILGNLAGAYAPSSGTVGFWLVGACYGPILPALLGILEWEGTHRIPGQSVGAIFALYSLSLLLVQPLFATFAKKRASRESMRVAMVIGLMMAAPMLVLALIRFKN